MQAEIHPGYHKVTMKCATCGNEFETHSTLDEDVVHVEICSQCHPFYTGKQRFADTRGRVDRFKKKYNLK